MESELAEIGQRQDRENHLLHDMLQEVEKSVILQALKLYGGNKTRTARHLGISRQWLHRRLNILGIETE